MESDWKESSLGDRGLGCTETSPQGKDSLLRSLHERVIELEKDLRFAKKHMRKVEKQQEWMVNRRDTMLEMELDFINEHGVFPERHNLMRMYVRHADLLGRPLKGTRKTTEKDCE